MDRKKIFGIFGGFLAVMLVFTILSRAVSGASMARVETVKISTGTIDHTVTGSGRVEAGKEVAVYTERDQRIQEICVQEGQSVEEGELLFTIDMEELEEQILSAEQELEKARLQNQDAQSASSVEQRDWELRKSRAEEDYSQAIAQGDANVASAKAALDEAEQALQEFLNKGSEDGGTETARKEGSRDDQEEENQEEENGGNDENSVVPETDESNLQPEADNSQWESQKAQLEQAAAEARAAYEAAISSRAENVKSAARELEDASQQKATDSTSRQNEITRQQQELALSKLQALKEVEGKITAPCQGVITNISITTGDFTTEGTAMRLADTSQGSRLTVSVDKSNEEYVNKGNPVTITVSGGREKISDYTVTSVTENEEDANLLDVVIDLPKGVLEAGTRADIEITQKSENYGTVLPIQALHEEQNGYYVLVVQEEQGVMGTELVARRLDVKIRDKNSTNVALEEGLLSGDQEVISSSTRSVEEGSRVRKKEA